MAALRSLYGLMRADFLERVRRYSFLIVLGVAVFAGYAFVPPHGAPYVTFVVGSHRGFYNSPWVGTLFGVVASTLLALTGFYLVKGAVGRDYQTRVGQVIAATPVARPLYVLGKWLSNLAVLLSILLVLTAMSPIMQIVRAEDIDVDLWALVAPIWSMGLPALAIASAMAVLFECIPFLRGGFGNVAYFFVWGPAMMGSTGNLWMFSGGADPRNDFAGLSRTMIDIHGRLAAGGYDASHGVSGVIGPRMGEEIIRFAWGGIEWTADVLLERLVWIGVAAAIALVAALPFDRFDPARVRGGGRRKRPRLGRRARSRQQAPGHPEVPGALTGTVVGLVPLGTAGVRWRLGAVFLAELRLMLKGRSWLWYAVAAGLVVATLVAPLDVSRDYLLAAVWIWPVLIWSEMGSREARYRTGPIVLSAAHPVGRQLPAAWLAGVAIAMAAGGGIAVRLVVAGEWAALFAWAVGVVFTPSLALALGAWTGSRKFFEIVYVLLWYLGPVNRVPSLDYGGVTDGAIASGVPFYYLGLTVVLLVAAAIGRMLRIRH
jgi:hypothetical protein